MGLDNFEIISVSENVRTLFFLPSRRIIEVDLVTRKETDVDQRVDLCREFPYGEGRSNCNIGH